MCAANNETKLASMTTPYSGKYAALDDDYVHVQNRKRPRHQSGTPPPVYNKQLIDKHYHPGPTKEQFQSMSQDDKLCSMFELLSNIGPMKYRIDNVEQHVYFSSAIHSVTDSRLRLLEYKSIDNEARQKQSNLIFTNINEPTNANENCIITVQNLLRDKLNLTSPQYEISKAYRIGPRRLFQKKPRSILVSFTDIRHTDTILSNASRLKGTSYGISRDYPSEINEARKALWPEFKIAREKYGPKKVAIKFPAALKVNGVTVKDHFPDWSEVLKGSRNSNVPNRVQEQVKILASEFIETSRSQNPSFKPVIESDSEESEDEPNVIDATAQNQHTPAAHAESSIASQLPSSDKTKRQAPSAPNGAPAPNISWTNPLNLSKTDATPKSVNPGGSHATDFATGIPNHSPHSPVTNV